MQIPITEPCFVCGRDIYRQEPGKRLQAWFNPEAPFTKVNTAEPLVFFLCDEHFVEPVGIPGSEWERNQLRTIGAHIRAMRARYQAAQQAED